VGELFLKGKKTQLKKDVRKRGLFLLVLNGLSFLLVFVSRENEKEKREEKEMGCFAFCFLKT